MYFERSRTLRYCREVSTLLATQRGLAGVRTAILPDFLVLEEAARALDGSPVMLGAQDLSEEDSGAFTGEVSGRELAGLGVRVVEVGHAERRTRYHEDAAQVAAKFRAACRNGLVPLLCVGEPLSSDPATAAQLCVNQVESAIADSDPDTEVWLGYEPHWAIGAAEPASSEYVSQVCREIRQRLGDPAWLSILYGGSARSGLLQQLDPSIDGLFLGRHAHDPQAFVQVVQEAAARNRPFSS